MDCSFLTDMALTDMTLDLGVLAQTAAGTVGRGVSWGQWLAVFVAMAVLIVPFVAGGYLAKMFKMPTYGVRFGWILLAIVASATVLLNSKDPEHKKDYYGPKYGVDLRGGTILVYEMDPSKIKATRAEGAQRIVSKDLVEPLTRRINPSGTQEIVIRPYGESQIEIIVPEVDQREVDRIKRLIEEAGILRFAILANQADHQPEMELATDQAESTNRTNSVVKTPDGEIVALWVNVDREEVDGKKGPVRVDVSGSLVRNPMTGQIVQLPVSGEEQIAAWIDASGMKGLEVLMKVDSLLDITGEDLAFATSTFDQNGAPAVSFTLTDTGSNRFFALTTNNAPSGSRQRQLGIILDDNLLSAPNILQPIRKEGRITGRFTRQEVEQLVQILKAGQLPAALTKQAIAENQIDATLGADTITKGVYAIAVSGILVILFILFYYRLPGVIACVALIMNLGMIMATMVLINQPLTLPGLAGLVLTVGMSVDANVLIFERIREELKKGAAARMAIRNGFAKASVTIIDANLTTLITAIVLYAIGTDQIRGFAVTLILGILFSMFTAIYVSRTLFDFSERHGFLSLSMSDGVNRFRDMISGESGLDFIGKSRMALVVSGILVCVGMASLYARGKGIFDIDFAGGSSVQFRVDQPTPSDKIRELVRAKMIDTEGEDVPFTVNGVSMAQADEQTVYKVDSSFENVDDLKKAVQQAFADSEDAELVTYSLKITPAGDESSLRSPSRSERNTSATNGVMLTAARAQDAAETDAAATETADAETAETETADAKPGDTDAAPETAETPAMKTIDIPLGMGPVVSSAVLEINIDGKDDTASINAATLRDVLAKAATEVDVALNEKTIRMTPMGDGAANWTEDSSLTFPQWRVDMPLAAADANQVMAQVKSGMDSDPVWISSSSVGSRVAGDMIGRAFGALFASILCIIGYIWFRFQRVLYGFAAVAALIHDVLITLGAIAVSYWLANALGFLMIDPFKISLTVVAAILTIIGYSLNDTIVVFDRIRETKGKAPKLTAEMINSSINQTLSRTLLTSITTLIVVLLLYWFGGEGIHAFAFALVIGVMVGTYSSVFIASPILLWLIQRSDRKASAA